MLGLKTYKIKSYEIGLKFVDGEFVKLLGKGKYHYYPFSKTRVEIFDMREFWFNHADLDLIVKHAKFKGVATVAELTDYEQGFVWVDGQLEKVINDGLYVLWNTQRKVEIDFSDQRQPWLDVDNLDLIVKSGMLEDKIQVLDLQDYQRALVWVDGRFDKMVSSGQYALWNTHRDIKVEIVDARDVRFNHKDINVIMKSAGASVLLEEIIVAEDHVGVYFLDGQYVETLPAGRYAFWKGVQRVKVFQVNLAELTLDITGQEIMTSDKVTLRLNAVVAYKVANAEKSVRAADDVRQSLYREVQLALRGVVGARDLESLLADKDGLIAELLALVNDQALKLGLQIVSLGIRDIILPGDMKNLLNKVTEAKKAAEANLISRREETAAMRSQANTAKLLENNPALMRLRELEVLEKISQNSKMSVVLGEKGLADRVVNLL